MMRKRPVVAIDGPSGVGKSTVARRVASALGFVYVDTGALYRTVALIGDRAGISWDDGTGLADELRRHHLAFDASGTLELDGEPLGLEIRAPKMSLGASAVARHKEVRDALLEVQRRLGQGGGVVLEGRDIGTVVFPDAEVKIFLAADLEVRARRRFLELDKRGDGATFEEVLSDQQRRDHDDANRALSPLKKADDAEEIPTDLMDADEVTRQIEDKIRNSFPLTSK
jgi:cytidylate kinase